MWVDHLDDNSHFPEESASLEITDIIQTTNSTFQYISRMIKSFRRRTRSLPFPRSEAGHAFSPNKNLAAGKKTRRAPTPDRREFFFLSDQNSPHRTKRKWSAQPSRHRFFWIFRSRPKIGGWGENNLAVPKSSMIFLAEHSFVYFVKIYTSICQSGNMYLSKLVHVLYILPIFQINPD